MLPVLQVQDLAHVEHDRRYGDHRPRPFHRADDHLCAVANDRELPLDSAHYPMGFDLWSRLSRTQHSQVRPLCFSRRVGGCPQIMILFYSVNVHHMSAVDLFELNVVFVILEFLLLISCNAIQEKRCRLHVFQKVGPSSSRKMHLSLLLALIVRFPLPLIQGLSKRCGIGL